jgi:hypothetical protein
MKILCAANLFCALVLGVLAGAEPPQPSISYFPRVRNVSVAQPEKQNYFVVDNDIWIHGRPDLGDIRLYDGTSPVQYSISEQRASVTSEQAEARILNLGSVSGHTEFDLDMAGAAEYDRVLLSLDAKDFVVSASVAGMNMLGRSPMAELPPSTLYDFTREKLGSNVTIKLPPSSFRYLHVKLSTGLRPQQIKGASIFNVHEQKAAWVSAGSCSAPQQKEHETVIECDVAEKVPVNRMQFQVEPSQVNFLRSVRAEDAKGRQVGSGEISRVRVTRAGSSVVDEKLDVDFVSTSGRLILIIDNGDNHPLMILAAQPLSFERRIYFDPQGKSALRLYYGDVKLSPPVYDYARFFHQDADAAKGQLGPAEHNAEYAGRPDGRPWSEQHRGVLWVVMIVAVLVLAALAIRGLRAQAQ